MNLIDELHKRIAEQPDAKAVYLWGNPGKSVSFGQLGEMIARHKQVLFKHDVKAGDILAVLIPDEVLDLVNFLCLTEIGAGSYMPSTKYEAFHSAKIFSIERLLILENDNQLKFRFIGPEPDKVSETNSNEGPLPWMLRTTSGTTGFPKSFVIDQQKAALRRTRYYDSIEIGPGDKFFSYTPLRMGAPRQRYFYALCSGASVVLGQNIKDLNDVVDAVNQSGATHLYCVPVHLTLLCDHAESNGFTKTNPLFQETRSIESTSAIIPPRLRTRVEQLLCRQFHIAYTMSEVGHISSTLRSAKSDPDLNDVGAAVEGVQIAIFDDDRKKIADGETGEIGVLFADETKDLTIYEMDPAGKPQQKPLTDTAEQENWYMTGDVGFISRNGNLVHLGRKDDMIIYKGSNIYPAEIERVALEHPTVSQAVAFGVPYEKFGQLPCLVVQLKTDQSMDKLFEHCHAHLDHRAPVFLQVMPKFPTNQMGKPLRNKIIEMVQPQVLERFNQD